MLLLLPRARPANVRRWAWKVLQSIATQVPAFTSSVWCAEIDHDPGRGCTAHAGAVIRPL